MLGGTALQTLFTQTIGLTLAALLSPISRRKRCKRSLGESPQKPAVTLNESNTDAVGITPPYTPQVVRSHVTVQSVQ